MFLFNIPWKHQKTPGFLVISRVYRLGTLVRNTVIEQWVMKSLSINIFHVKDLIYIDILHRHNLEHQPILTKSCHYIETSPSIRSTNQLVCFLYVMRWAIWYHLYNLKNVKNTIGRVLLLESSASKSDTPPSVFLTFFKLHKWYKIAQSISFNVTTGLKWVNLNLADWTSKNNVIKELKHVDIFLNFLISRIINPF